MKKILIVLCALGTLLIAQQTDVLTWTFRSPLPQPGRCQIQGHGNVRDTIYVCGGRASGAIAIRTVQAYVPAADLWITTLPAMPGPRSHGSGDVLDTLIVVAGGFDSSGVMQNTFYAFNANTKTWSTLDSMPAKVILGAGASNGSRFSIFGSQNNGDSLLDYNPSMGGWSVRRPATRPTGRRAAAAAGTASYYYVMGGINAAGTVLSDCWRYSRPGGGTWTQMANMPGPRVMHAAYTFVGDSVIYVVGGNPTGLGGTNDTMVYKYTIATNTWTTDAPMQVSRGFLILDRAGSKIYAIGGISGSTYFTTNEEGGPIVGGCDEENSRIRAFEYEVSPSLVRSRGTINYRLAQASHVTIKLYNTAGQTVMVLTDAMQEAGAHTADFNGTALSEGVYLVQLDVNGVGAGVKLVVFK
jgi:hypothetical protein